MSGFDSMYGGILGKDQYSEIVVGPSLVKVPWIDISTSLKVNSNTLQVFVEYEHEMSVAETDVRTNWISAHHRDGKRSLLTCFTRELGICGALLSDLQARLFGFPLVWLRIFSWSSLAKTKPFPNIIVWLSRNFITFYKDSYGPPPLTASSLDMRRYLPIL